MANKNKQQITNDDVLIQSIHNNEIEYLKKEVEEVPKQIKFCKLCYEQEATFLGLCDDRYKEEHIEICRNCNKSKCDCDKQYEAYYDK